MAPFLSLYPLPKLKTCARFFLLVLGVCLAQISNGQDKIVFPFGSEWTWKEGVEYAGLNWNTLLFNDQSWNSGLAPFGSMREGVNTELTPEPNWITTYFRKTFSIQNKQDISKLEVRLKRDDGAVVYINGLEVMRSNMYEGPVSVNTSASTNSYGKNEEIVWKELVHPYLLEEGENIVAVELHRKGKNNADALFDLEIIKRDSFPEVIIEPYIQGVGTNRAVIKWWTNAPEKGRVLYGTDPTEIVNESIELTAVHNHEVEIRELDPDTRYYYAVVVGGSLFGPNETYTFKTAKSKNDEGPVRFWVLGDAGTGLSAQHKVRDALIEQDQWPRGNPDLLLMLGDNVYEHGRWSEYQSNCFGVYKDLMRQIPFFPATGNHDLMGGADAQFETGPFYDLFALPTNGEQGGHPSERESYFSFDWGNVHFLCLESYTLDRSSFGEMAKWIQEDLNNNASKWTIAYWHYSPYSKIGHDTDVGAYGDHRSIEMRENIVPILESYGVDLILSGHSHSYERSYMLHGHYGYSSSLESSMILNNSNGNALQGNGYHKVESPDGKGTVYAVSGSSGKVSKSEERHPVMAVTYIEAEGAMIVETKGDTLQGQFLNKYGVRKDVFHILKSDVGFSSLQENQNLHVFPNPIEDGQFAIRFQAKGLNSKEVVVYCYGVSGNLIGKWKRFAYGNGDQLRVNVDYPLAPGAYRIEVRHAGSKIGSKMITVQ